MEIIPLIPERDDVAIQCARVSQDRDIRAQAFV